MNQSKTLQNLESAFAGESMAHAKYLYFAKICRQQGDLETAQLFEATAKQEVVHAHSHLELLYPVSSLTPKKCLELAIKGETYEYTEMYPGFKKEALEEGNSSAVAEIDEQIAESFEHAEQFKSLLEKASKRFTALSKVEEHHANTYRAQLNSLNVKGD